MENTTGLRKRKKDKIYDVEPNKKVYKNNYVMGAVLLLLGVIFIPYSKVATGLFWVYGVGLIVTVYRMLKIKIHVEGNTFTLSGTKDDGEYQFSDVDRIVYRYNKKDQRRYFIFVDGHRICEVPAGSINGRDLYNDMTAAGVPGGFDNAL